MSSISEILYDLSYKARNIKAIACDLYVAEKALRYEAMQEPLRQRAMHSDIESAAELSDEANMLEALAEEFAQHAYDIEKRVEELEELLKAEEENS